MKNCHLIVMECHKAEHFEGRRPNYSLLTFEEEILMDLVSVAPVTEETQDSLRVTVPTQRE